MEDKNKKLNNYLIKLSKTESNELFSSIQGVFNYVTSTQILLFFNRLFNNKSYIFKNISICSHFTLKEH